MEVCENCKEKEKMDLTTEAQFSASGEITYKSVCFSCGLQITHEILDNEEIDNLKERYGEINEN